MPEQFLRTELLLGRSSMKKLANANILLFGLGGVGGYICEALVRSGIGHITIVDSDKVDITNINRQIIATMSSVGRYKCDVMEERIHDINPLCQVDKRICFYLPENKDEFDFKSYDYIIDAIDTVTAKISIIEEATKENVKIISAMGAGNKMDPLKFIVTDIYKTKVDPLARVLRTELKKRGIKKLKVVYSEEEPFIPTEERLIDKETNKPVPLSNSFVPSTMGLIIASEVVKDIIESE